MKAQRTTTVYVKGYPVLRWRCEEPGRWRLDEPLRGRRAELERRHLDGEGWHFYGEGIFGRFLGLSFRTALEEATKLLEQPYYPIAAGED